MCGFAGIVDPERRLDLSTALRDGDPILARRGPDGDGSLVDRARGVALGHHRLAITDPRPEADQPMTSATGRFTIVFNGAIHDHPERRAELEADGATFRTTSDTEVLLAGFERWGVTGMLDRVDGMFAIAVLDRQSDEIVLARDRAGQKPLLLATASGCIAFASDLRALEAMPSPFRERLAGIDPDALHWFLALGVVPWPMSIRPGVEQVPPGGLVRVSLKDGSLDRGRWWTPPPVDFETDPDGPLRSRSNRDERTLLDVLRESVHRRCRADRPIGMFLSGGIDSRIVAGLASEVLEDLPCYTLASTGPFDESDEAARIAAAIGGRHHVIRPSADEVDTTAASLGTIADEPFADASLVATTLLARAAREEVVVALGGDGGDELFGGYRRHLAAHRRTDWRSRVERLAARGIQRLPARLRGGLRIGRHALGELASRRLLVGADAIDYLGLRSTQGDAAGVLRPRPGDPNALDRARERAATGGVPTSPWDGVAVEPRDARGVMMLDFRTYLPDDPLRKVDAGTMSVALEHRAPFLGREVMEHAWRLGTDQLFDRGGGRAPVRAALRDLGLPDRATKRGFAVPIHDWLRGPLRDRAAAMMLEPAEDPLSPGAVAELFDGVQAGRRDLSTACWTVFCWRSWLRSREALR